MRVSLLMEGIPEAGGSGGAMAMWTLLRHLVDSGHSVTAVLLVMEWDRERGSAEIEARRRALAVGGVDAHVIDVRPQPSPAGCLRRLAPSLTVDPEELFAHRGVREDVEAALAAARPEAVLAFDTGSLVAVRRYRGAPVLAVPGDPPWLVWKYRLRLQARDRSLRLAREFARYLVLAPRMRRFVVRLVREFAALAAFGEQHADWFRSQGVACSYLPVPVADRSAGLLTDVERPTPRRILVLGGLRSTATQLGLWLLVREMLPQLGPDLVARGAEIHVAGGGSLPTELERRLRDAGVVLRGYVADSAAEMREATVFLVPAPYPVGARTRIVEALSAGCAIVAHDLSACGLPELADGVNCVLAADGAQLARAVRAVLDDADLAAGLRAAARETYEQHFAPPVACGIVERELARLAAPTVGATA